MSLEDYGYAYIGTTPNSKTVAIPYPSNGSGAIEAQVLVDSGRNANGVVVATKIGRTNYKVNMQWNAMTPDKWVEIATFLDNNFYFYLTFYNFYTGKTMSIRCYHGNLSGEPFMINKETNKPRLLLNIVFNAIDTGE